MLSPERDQTSTINALREIEAFLRLYPNSQHMPEVLALQKQARDRLSDSEYRVGLLYFRSRWYPRRRPAVRGDSQGRIRSTTRRDAVYYHLAESLLRTRTAEGSATSTSTGWSRSSRSATILTNAQARVTELTQLRDRRPAEGCGSDCGAGDG